MDQDHNAYRKQDQSGHRHHKRSHSGGHLQEGSPPAKKPMDQAQPSLDEANRQVV
jgi:hypothetical protein